MLKHSYVFKKIAVTYIKRKLILKLFFPQRARTCLCLKFKFHQSTSSNFWVMRFQIFNYASFSGGTNYFKCPSCIAIKIRVKGKPIILESKYIMQYSTWQQVCYRVIMCKIVTLMDTVTRKINSFRHYYETIWSKGNLSLLILNVYFHNFFSHRDTDDSSRTLSCDTFHLMAC